MSKATMIELSRLTFDPAIYPRDHVDPENVRALVRAIEAGAKLPPIVVEAGTFRIVDGVHRFHAYKASGMDADAKVAVTPVRYDSERDLFLAAIAANAAHGKRLASYDVATIAVRAEQFKLTREQLAGALQMTVESFEGLTAKRIAYTGPATRPTIVKRTIGHLAGENLSEAENAANDKLGGMQARWYVGQVLTLLRSERLIRWDDDGLVEDLIALRDELTRTLRDRSVEKAS